MKRRGALKMALAAGLGGVAGLAHTAASDWEQSFGYPSGWGPRNDWNDKTYRIGNYSGGYERMLRARAIRAAGEAAPLQAISAAGAESFATVAGLADSYMKAWPSTGLLIARKGVVLYERYQFGRTAEQRMTSWSMAKSVTSLLLGICVDRGLVKSMDDTAETYVPRLKGTLHGGVTLRNLANMSSGAEILHDRDNPSIYPRAFLSPNADIETVVAGWNTPKEPQGTRYNYNELCPLTIGMVIRQVTGKSMSEFCQEALWQPLGAAGDASWLCDSGGREFNCIGFGAQLRDWARLGQMIAQGGQIQGRQVVSRAWLEECATWSPADAQVRQKVATPQDGYKYFFWHPRANGSLLMMVGAFGQRLLVDKPTQTVFVHTGVDSAGAWNPHMNQVFRAAVAARELL